MILLTKEKILEIIDNYPVSHGAENTGLTLAKYFIVIVSNINGGKEMGLAQLIKKYNDTGRIAFHYPRLKRVSFNGGRSVTEKEAARRITEFLNTSNSMGLK